MCRFAVFSKHFKVNEKKNAQQTGEVNKNNFTIFVKTFKAYTTSEYFQSIFAWRRVSTTFKGLVETRTIQIASNFFKVF